MYERLEKIVVKLHSIKCQSQALSVVLGEKIQSNRETPSLNALAG